MTFRTTISSKDDPKKFLHRGFKSMFGNYEASPEKSPANSEKEQTKNRTT